MKVNIGTLDAILKLRDEMSPALKRAAKAVVSAREPCPDSPSAAHLVECERCADVFAQRAVASRKRTANARKREAAAKRKKRYGPSPA